MIQTKTQIICNAESQKKAIVRIEVKPLLTNDLGQNFLRIDRDINDIENPIYSKEVFWTNEQINEMEDYLEANNDFSGLTRVEKEKKKLQLALMITITQTNIFEDGKTYYGQNPNNWELTEI